MRAGKLRHRVEVQRLNSVQDAHGNNVDTWTTAARVWAHISPMEGSERMTQDKLTAEVTHEVLMRFRDVTPKQRIRYGTRLFDVNRVLNVDERDREIVCLCREAV